MDIPKSPPSMKELMQKFGSEQMLAIAESVRSLPRSDSYYHWDRLRFITPPPGFSSETWWLGLKMNRSYSFKNVPLFDTLGRPFCFFVTDFISEQLHYTDLGAGGRIGVPEPVTNAETKDQYYVSSLIEEAITSSQLEGAATTREVAKEMLRSARPPRDRDERMILNNFLTMKQIGQLKERPLTEELVLEIHRSVTEQTLDDPTASGRFRHAEEAIIVGDAEDGVFHVPPPAKDLASRMKAMCDFANGKTPDYFVHPVLRSLILHFWLAYDHPFVDGNGRTARALFYWSMLRHGFWLFEFISISSILRKAPIQYARSFLYTETDDNDLTYFLQYQIEVIQRALGDLHKYIETQSQRVKQMEQSMRGTLLLNHRQRTLISHALRHPQQRYTIEGHRSSHAVAYQTARADLMDLAEREVMQAQKVGKTWYFSPVQDFEARLARLS
ncbi:MAG: Fic family protein [Janthinobacterium lividum]